MSSKSVRVTKKTYNQLNELKANGYESLTNALSVAVDRLYMAERPKETTMEVARHKSGEGSVVLKEGDRGYIVTVHKHGMPPHYSKLYDTMQEAAADFERLARGKGDEQELIDVVRLHYNEGWSTRQIAEALVGDWFANYREAIRQVDAIISAEWERAIRVTLP